MQKTLFTRPGKFVKRIALLVLVHAFYYIGTAQSYIGYHSSSYAGVYAIITSPADILNHRTRGDINLIGFSTGIGNNIISFNYKNRNDDKSGISFPDPITKSGKMNFNTDIFGPSILIKLSDKNAIAFTTRARVFTNVHGVGIDILNSELPDTISQPFIGTTLSAGNMSANIHAWKEIAFTYSRQIANSDFGVWKAGVSLKYLGGIAALSLHTNNLTFIHDSILDPTDNKMKDAFYNVKGNIVLATLKI